MGREPIAKTRIEKILKGEAIPPVEDIDYFLKERLDDIDSKIEELAESSVPEITAEDEGKVLSVENGEAVWGEAQGGVPQLRPYDAGYPLMATIPSDAHELSLGFHSLSKDNIYTEWESQDHVLRVECISNFGAGIAQVNLHIDGTGIEEGYVSAYDVNYTSLGIAPYLIEKFADFSLIKESYYTITWFGGVQCLPAGTWDSSAVSSIRVNVAGGTGARTDWTFFMFIHGRRDL